MLGELSSYSSRREADPIHTLPEVKDVLLNAFLCQRATKLNNVILSEEPQAGILGSAFVDCHTKKNVFNVPWEVPTYLIDKWKHLFLYGIVNVI